MMVNKLEIKQRLKAQTTTRMCASEDKMINFLIGLAIGISLGIGLGEWLDERERSKNKD